MRIQKRKISSYSNKKVSSSSSRGRRHKLSPFFLLQASHNEYNNADLYHGRLFLSDYDFNLVSKSLVLTCKGFDDTIIRDATNKIIHYQYQNSNQISNPTIFPSTDDRFVLMRLLFEYGSNISITRIMTSGTKQCCLQLHSSIVFQFSSFIHFRSFSLQQRSYL